MSEHGSTSDDTSGVIFVCMGNICRSPAGEGVMKKLVADRGLQQRIHVDSAGTIGYHEGAPPDRRMTASAAERGYQLDGRARPFSTADFDIFDLIVAMDRDNLADLRELDPHGQYRGKIKLLSEFLPPDSPPDVPDPYYGGAIGFARVLDMVEQACPVILDTLLTPR
jgi:protein-tyrosine phosphatase